MNLFISKIFYSMKSHIAPFLLLDSFAWIREHPEMALGGALIAGVLIGSSEETMEAVARNGPKGIRLAQALLAGIREGIPPGGETKA